MWLCSISDVGYHCLILKLLIPVRSNQKYSQAAFLLSFPSVSFDKKKIKIKYLIYFTIWLLKPHGGSRSTLSRGSHRLLFCGRSFPLRGRAPL